MVTNWVKITICEVDVGKKVAYGEQKGLEFQLGKQKTHSLES